MRIVSEIKKIQSLGNDFSILLLIFTIYNLKNSYFLHKIFSIFHNKLYGQYSKGIIGIMKFENFLLLWLFFNFLLIFTFYNLNNWYFIYKNCKKFEQKQVGEY